MYSRIEDLLLGFVCFQIYWLSSCGSQSHTEVKVGVGQKASLFCSVDITGKIHVEWLDPQGIFLTDDERVVVHDQRFSVRHPYWNEWYLEVNNVRHSDAGNYTCRIGPVPEIRRYVELVLTNPPEMTDPSGEGSYMVNSTVTLTCDARGVPQPRITWYRLENHKRIDLNAEGSTYVIESITWSQGGAYECHATNGVPPIAMATLVVEVLFAPIVRIPYREVLQEEGRWTQLSCIIFANPAPRVYWMRKEEKIEDSASLRVEQDDTFGARYQVTLRLTVEQLSASDYGLYKCHAENRHGRDQGAVSLRGPDNKKPLLVSAPRDSIAAVGEDTLMNCSFLNLPKGHSVIWWHTSTSNETRKLFESQSGAKNSKRVTVRANLDRDRTNGAFDGVKHEIVGQYNLIIRRTNYSDQGVYVCQLSGHENYSAVLKVIANRNPSAICNDQKQTSPSLNTTLIILAVVVVLVLVIAIAVVIMVYKLLLKRAAKDSGYPVELSLKVNKIGE